MANVKKIIEEIDEINEAMKNNPALLKQIQALLKQHKPKVKITTKKPKIILKPRKKIQLKPKKMKIKLKPVPKKIKGIKLKKKVELYVTYTYEWSVKYTPFSKWYSQDPVMGFMTYENAQYTNAQIEADIEQHIHSILVLNYFKKQGDVRLDSFTWNKISQSDIPSNVDLTKLPMFGVGRIRTFHPKQVEFDKGNRECVSDWILTNYVKRKLLSWISEVDGVRQIHYLRKPEDVMFVMDLKTLKNGVTARDLERMCYRVGITMSGLSLAHDYQTFIKVTRDNLKDAGVNRNTNADALIFLMADQHFYPIKNAEWIVKIASINRDHVHGKVIGGGKSGKPKKNTDEDIDNEEDNEKPDEGPRTMCLNVPLKDILSPQYHKCLLLYETGSLRSILRYLVSQSPQIFPRVLKSKGSISRLELRPPHYAYDIVIQKVNDVKMIEEMAKIANIPCLSWNVGFFSGYFLKEHLKKNQFELTSRFNSMTLSLKQNLGPYNAVYALPKPVDLVCAYDIVKHYRTSLLTNQYRYPVFSVLDEPEPFTGKIPPGCVCWIETQDSRPPLQGKRWYSEEVTRWCLGRNRIAPDQITYIIRPSSTLPHDWANPVVDQIVTTFKDHDAKADSNNQFGKTVTNALIGQLGTAQNNRQAKVILTTNLHEASYYLVHSAGECHIKAWDYHDDPDNPERIYEIHENIDAFEVVIAESTAPIRNQILDRSHIILAELIEQITHKGGTILGIETDCVFMTGFNEPTFTNGSEPIQYRYISQSNTQGWIEQTKSTKNDLPLPLSAPTSHARDDWINLRLPPLLRTDFQAKAEEIMSSQQGCFIDGLAGTGKTYMGKLLIELYGKNNCSVLAPTNKACQLLGGSTFHMALGIGVGESNFVRNMVKRVGQSEVIVVDEISMVTLYQWYLLFLMKLTFNPKIILLGDLRQCSAVNPKCHRKHDYENSQLLKYLVDGQRMTLTKNQRSDDVMWNLVKDLMTGQNLMDQVQRYDSNKQCIYKNLCYRNNTRLQINQQCQQQWVKEFPGTTIIMELGDATHRAKYRIGVGMPVIAKVSCRKLTITNNEEFTITKITDAIIRVKNDVHELDIPLLRFAKKFDMAFAITIHKSQGSTYMSPYVIHEWMDFGHDRDEVMRLRYTAITRTSRFEDVYLK